MRVTTSGWSNSFLRAAMFVGVYISRSPWKEVLVVSQNKQNRKINFTQHHSITAHLRGVGNGCAVDFDVTFKHSGVEI